MDAKLLLLWIIFLPVMLNRYLCSGRLFERVQVSDILFLSLFVIFLIKRLKGSVKFTFTGLRVPLAVLLASFLISGLKSALPFLSLSEAVVFAYLALIYLTAANIIVDTRTMSLCLKGYVFSSLIVALLGIAGVILASRGIASPFVRFYPAFFLDKSYRLISTMPLPNMAYSYLHTGLFLCLGLLLNQRRLGGRIFYLFTLLALAAAIFFTFSRGCIALLTGLACFLYFIRKGFFPFKFIACLLFLTALAVFIFTQLFITYTTDLSLSVKSGYDSGYTVDHFSAPKNRLFKCDGIFEQNQPYNRIDIALTFLPGDYWYKKKAAIALWRQNPFFGAGPGMFNIGFAKLKESNYIYIPRNFPPSDPHSTYFGALAEQGLSGLAALLILYFYFLKICIGACKRIKEPYFKNLILCCISAFIGLMVFAIDVDIMNFRWLWFLMGLAIAIIKIAESGGYIPAEEKNKNA